MDMNQPKRHSQGSQEMTPLAPTDDGKDGTEPGDSVQVSKKPKYSRYRRLRRKIGFRQVWSILAIVLYTLLGGAIFLASERPVDLQERQQLYAIYLTSQKQLVKRIEELSVSFSEQTNRGDLVRQIQSAILWYEDKVGVRMNNESLWDFWNAMYYAGTVYTTIGYGNVACKTVIGRVLTIIYALFGIPLVLTRLPKFGRIMFMLMVWMVDKFFKTLSMLHLQQWVRRRTRVMNLRRKSTFAWDGSNSELVKNGKPSETAQKAKRPYRDRRIPITIAVSFTVGWIFLCAGIFTIWERWSYFEAVYFFFISLSTIGLGDVVPDHPRYMIMNYGLVIIGLSLVTVCISVVQDRVEILYYNLLKRIFKEYQKQLAKGMQKKDAEKGMMNLWNSSTLARMLMPLISKEKKEVILQKFTDAVEAHGISVPDLFKEVDPESGMPTMFVEEGQQQISEAMTKSISEPCETVVDIEDEYEPVDAIFGVHEDPTFFNDMKSLQGQIFANASMQTDQPQILGVGLQTVSQDYMQSQEMQTTLPITTSASTSAVVALDAEAGAELETADKEVQSENVALLEDKVVQTELLVNLKDSFAQTTCHDDDDSSKTDRTTSPEVKDEESQAEQNVSDQCMQTSLIKQSNEETFTELLEMVEREIQTIEKLRAVSCVDDSTATSSLDLNDQEVQVESPTKQDNSTQYASRLAEFFPSAVKVSTADGCTQTEVERAARRSFSGGFSGAIMNQPLEVGRRKPMHRLRRFASTLRQDRRRSRRNSELISERERVGLKWHPIDGKHAEQQIPVRELKAFWEDASSGSQGSEKSAQ